jgi:hypothetical protein
VFLGPQCPALAVSYSLVNRDSSSRTRKSTRLRARGPERAMLWRQMGPNFECGAIALVAKVPDEVARVAGRYIGLRPNRPTPLLSRRKAVIIMDWLPGLRWPGGWPPCSTSMSRERTFHSNKRFVYCSGLIRPSRSRVERCFSIYGSAHALNGAKRKVFTGLSVRR